MREDAGPASDSGMDGGDDDDDMDTDDRGRRTPEVDPRPASPSSHYPQATAGADERFTTPPNRIGRRRGESAKTACRIGGTANGFCNPVAYEQRPVATPCRARAPPVEDTYCWHLGVLDTLLDECASESWEWALLASTLLETLTEHLYAVRGCGGPSCSGAVDRYVTALGADQEASGVGATGDEVATAIQLHAHLPRGVSFDLSSVNFRLGCSLDDVLLLFHSRYWSLPRSIPEAVRLHPQAEVFRHLAGMPLPGPISATDPGWQYFRVVH